MSETLTCPNQHNGNPSYEAKKSMMRKLLVLLTKRNQEFVTTYECRFLRSAQGSLGVISSPDKIFNLICLSRLEKNFERTLFTVNLILKKNWTGTNWQRSTKRTKYDYIGRVRKENIRVLPKTRVLRGTKSRERSVDFPWTTVWRHVVFPNKPKKRSKVQNDTGYRYFCRQLLWKDTCCL